MTSLADFNPMEGKFIYQSPANDQELEGWLDEVVHDRSSYVAQAGGSTYRAVEMVREEVGAFEKMRSKWMFEVYHITPPGTMEDAVVLHVGHALFDGMGAIQVLDLWLRELADVLSHREDLPCWGEEHVRLPPAMPDRMAIPWTPEPTPSDHFMVQKIVHALQRPPPNVKLPVIKPTAEPTLSGNLVKTFPRGFSEKLRLAARAHGCSILSAVFAANYLTLLHLFPRQSIPKGELFVHIYPAGADLRSQYLSGGPETQKDRRNWQIGLALSGNVIGAYHMERFLGSDRPLDDVWTLGREVQAQVVEQQPYQASAAQWVPAIIGAMLAKYSNDYVPESLEYRSVNVSSLGVLDPNLSKTFGPPNNPVFTISTPIFSAIGPTLTSDGVGVLLAPYTWDGVFSMSWSYAVAYMGTEAEQMRAEREGKVTLRRYVEELTRLIEQLAEAGR
ncbi:hypothetical protein CALVIDRAFT_531269 [Calocera viscosa TUFC12733]|uniref:Diacylglycerol O-acyltransferase n=1 Tax=Calocera viscosa (strain TUFC12733) TaxID=1330018 RepID=A0A167GNS7_CALVF|nr:hypothetical protein CALVIDRAFT_531269 [Calocera viscosa TUFC12733]